MKKDITWKDVSNNAATIAAVIYELNNDIDAKILELSNSIKIKSGNHANTLVMNFKSKFDLKNLGMNVILDHSMNESQILVCYHTVESLEHLIPWNYATSVKYARLNLMKRD
jgi:hypothetical protein